MMGRIPVTDNFRGIIAHLIMLREQHNLENPDAPIYQRDIAEYIGLKTKTTMTNYESGYSVPRMPILLKWLEFWGEGLFVGPLEEEEEDE